jgi:hypothetical protein
MSTTATSIGEHDLVTLRNPVGGWPAGTRGAVVSVFPMHRWVEVVDESDDWGFTIISVPTDQLEVAWKSPRTADAD